MAAAVERDVSRHRPAPERAARQRAACRKAVASRAQTAEGFSATASLGAATAPAVFYGFDGMGCGDGQAQLQLYYNAGERSGRLSLGAFTTTFNGRGTKLMPDGTYLSEKVGGDSLVYAGWLSHWWGPGWISALVLSNNARPRSVSSAGGASSWPVLEWLGPWQAEIFIGLLDAPRFDRNTGYDAVHFIFNPLPGLEIGLARTVQICGRHHPCVPLRDTFDFNNSATNTNRANDEGEIDVKWSRAIFGVPM